MRLPIDCGAHCYADFLSREESGSLVVMARHCREGHEHVLPVMREAGGARMVPLFSNYGPPPMEYATDDAGH